MRRLPFDDPPRFQPGDRVKTIEGSFAHFEGEIEAVDQESERISILLTIFGRKTPVEAEMWQIQKVIN
jgi:transcriptional antiterminator NusG